MKYTIFGKKTGLRVSEMALGTGSFGTRWGYGAQPDEARRIFDRYVEAGGNFIDTANGYQLGESEELLGTFIGDRRDELVLASKYSIGGKSMLTSGNSRKTMVRAVEESLKRLKTDRIDLYWAHMSDGQTPIEEIVRGFDDLVRDGKILYAGFSNFPAWRIANASLLADLRGWSPIAGIQIEYNLLERTADRELLPMAEALGLGVAFWSPLAGGSLTGKYRTNIADSGSRKESWNGFLLKQESSEQHTAILDLLESIAAENKVKVIDVALAWMRQKDDQRPLSTVTIIGPRTVNQLEDNLASLNVSLSIEQISALNVVSAISLGAPHQVIAEMQPALFGAGSGLIAHQQVVA
jgi:aryl-alcohol dehydrogenase-like predicted oxidoreductase